MGFFNKKIDEEKKDEKNFKMTVYFISGLLTTISFNSVESLDHWIKRLREGWNTCFVINNEYGINFSLVTHYEIING